jgi:hypothetical protein
LGKFRVLSVIIQIFPPPSGQVGMQRAVQGRFIAGILPILFGMCYNNSKDAVSIKYHNIADVPE